MSNVIFVNLRFLDKLRVSGNATTQFHSQTEMTFDSIKQNIQEYDPVEIILSCYNVLDEYKEETLPVWSILLLIKWTYQHSVVKDSYKPLTDKDYSDLVNSIYNFNQEHISNFIHDGKIEKAFHILYHQQFYLQKSVYKEIFETQLKLYHSIKGKYDIGNSFFTKTKLTVLEFLKISQVFWLYINIGVLKGKELKFNGYYDKNFLKITSELFGREKVLSYLKLLTLNPQNPVSDINVFKRGIQREDLQIVETTFFVMFPFQIVRDNVKLIHESVFKHTINYYIYDYLKSTDDSFTTEFGYRLEKYVGLGLKEMKINFKNETELKKQLPKKSPIVDYFISEQNIYIECKATELQPYPSVNPLDDLLINSLKSSLFKAYFEQFIPVAKTVTPNTENWGIIITYKEFYWSTFTELYNIGKDQYSSANDFTFMPYDNVFIIDIYTWDKIVQIVKDKKATLLEILKVAKNNNSKQETSKQLFNMHLDIYNIYTLDLDYLKDEHVLLDLK